MDKLPMHGAALLTRGELAFDRSDLASAVELGLRFLRHTPTANRTDRAAGLDLLVRASTCVGEIERAKTALGELTNISQIVNTIPLHAAASFAAGYLALGEGEPEVAREHFEDAIDLFLKSGAPFEVARARVHLARALSGLGRVEPALEQLQSAIEALSQLKAEADLALAHSIRSSLTGPQSRSENDSHAGSLSGRELEVLQLVAEGLSNQAIASRLFVSDHTVHRHLANILNKLDVSTRAAAVAQAVRRGLLR